MNKQTQEQKQEAKHTALPWEHNNYGLHRITTPEGQCIVEICGVGEELIWNEETAANAAFIVKCVNSHYELIEALKEALKAIPTSLNGKPRTDDVFEVIEQALAKCE